MKKSFIFCLIFLIIALSETKTVSRVKLQQSSKPVYQNFLGANKVDLSYPYLINADFGSIKDVPLAINLFNSHFFITTCGDKFATSFNCSDHTDICVPFPKLPYSADLPNLRLNGYRMILNVSLGNFGRGNRIKGFVATQCVGMPYDSDKVVGAVGLSLNHSNYKNFDSENNRFSIHLKNNEPTGELIFGQDNAYSDGVQPLRMMGVTRNWEIPVDGLTMLDLILDFTGHAIFDLNSNYLGVPDNIYNGLLLDLNNRFKFNCQLKTRIPNCTYDGDISKLPPIVLMTSERNNPISIPSQVYSKKIGDNLYQLLFVSLTPSPISKHQIFVTDTYKDYIVLGAPFMSYYYTVFLYEDTNNPEIQLYGPNGGDNKKTGGLSAWAIVGIVLGALLLIGLVVGGIYAFKKNKDKRKTESLVAPDTRVGYISYNQ